MKKKIVESVSEGREGRGGGRQVFWDTVHGNELALHDLLSTTRMHREEEQQREKTDTR